MASSKRCITNGKKLTSCTRACVQRYIEKHRRKLPKRTRLGDVVTRCLSACIRGGGGK